MGERRWLIGACRGLVCLQMTAGCKSPINKFFPIDKSKGERKQLAVAKQSCQVKLSGSNQTEYEAGQPRGLGTLDKGGPGKALWESSVEWAHRELTMGKENGKWGSCGVGGWRLWTWESESIGQIWGCPVSHWTDISLSALRNQPMKKQLSAKGRRATQTTWSEKENALVPCALNQGASQHPGSGVEFQQPFLDAYCVPHNPSSVVPWNSWRKIFPLVNLYVSHMSVNVYHVACMHACAQAMWGCFQAIIC